MIEPYEEPTTMRAALAWTAAFIIWIALGLALTVAGRAVGIPSSIDLDAPVVVTHGGGGSSYDEERTSLQTFYGLASMGLSFAVSVWAGRAIHSRRWSANFSRKGWYAFVAWTISLLSLTVLAALLHLAYGSLWGTMPYFARYIVEVGATVGVGLAGLRWYRRRTRQFEMREGA